MGKYSKKGKYSRKANTQRKVLTVTCAVLGVVLVLLVMILVRMNASEHQVPGVSGEDVSSTNGEEYQEKELQIQNVTEQDDTVLVETTYGTLRYPYAFSDLMSVEAEVFEDYSALNFNATLDGKTVKLYTLLFNMREGVPVGTLEVEDQMYAITAQFHDPEGVSDENIVTFYAVQETFNDVVNSLSENEGFTAAD